MCVCAPVSIAIIYINTMCVWFPLFVCTIPALVLLPSSATLSSWAHAHRFLPCYPGWQGSLTTWLAIFEVWHGFIVNGLAIHGYTKHHPILRSKQLSAIGPIYISLKNMLETQGFVVGSSWFGFSCPLQFLGGEVSTLWHRTHSHSCCKVWTWHLVSSFEAIAAAAACPRYPRCRARWDEAWNIMKWW